VLSSVGKTNKSTYYLNMYIYVSVVNNALLIDTTWIPYIPVYDFIYAFWFIFIFHVF